MHASIKQKIFATGVVNNPPIPGVQPVVGAAVSAQAPQVPQAAAASESKS